MQKGIVVTGDGPPPSAKLWGGRFSQPTNALVDELNASIGFDQRFARHDLAGSIAHSRMLAQTGIIEERDQQEIERGLKQVWSEIQAGTHEFRQADEDIHLSVEGRLRAIIGSPAGRLHTGRSRNDQVATDFRMWCREAILMLASGLVDTVDALLEVGDRYPEAILPGYTHLQRAQPVLLRHHMLAYGEMLLRDLDRLGDAYRRTNQSPLGAGALAGVTYPIDREATAEMLGFDGACANSLDAVSDRDFVIDTLSACSQISMHLSRLAEELVIWSTPEFGFIELDDAFATGSSIMPQKKNPDVAELVRGKSGRLIGNLTGLLATLKGLPLAYNRDLQEDKLGLFQSADILATTLTVYAAMLPKLQVNAERAMQAASGGYLLATDVADYLVRKGMPFRDAHAAVSELVRFAESAGKALGELTLEEYRRFSPEFQEDVLALDVHASIDARDVAGGTASNRVSAALKEARKRLEGAE